MTTTSKRRWYQFSLKMLLVGLTVLCIGPGGYVAYEQAKARKQKAAVEAIEVLGGIVFLDDKSPPRSATMRQILGDERFGTVHSVSFGYQSQMTDAGLVHFECLTNLTVLSLWGTEVTDAGLVHLTRLKNLKLLSLDDTKATDAGVAKLQKALPNCKIVR